MIWLLVGYAFVLLVLLAVRARHGRGRSRH